MNNFIKVIGLAEVKWPSGKNIDYSWIQDKEVRREVMARTKTEATDDKIQRALDMLPVPLTREPIKVPVTPGLIGSLNVHHLPSWLQFEIQDNKKEEEITLDEYPEDDLDKKRKPIEFLALDDILNRSPLYRASRESAQTDIKPDTLGEIIEEAEMNGFDQYVGVNTGEVAISNPEEFKLEIIMRDRHILRVVKHYIDYHFPELFDEEVKNRAAREKIRESKRKSKQPTPKVATEIVEC